MTDQAAQIPDRRLTTPRAAAVAGIVFAVFSIVTFSILNAHIPAVNADTGDWLETSKGPVTLALALIPFAGIAFLWFIGVQRDRLGLLEDQFFSTLFFGSGLLYLGLVFAGATMAGGTMMAYSLSPDIFTDSPLYTFARAVIHQITNVYSIRMAGMFMIVMATIWVRTEIMPRWMAIITYGLALVLLVSVSFVPWITEVFPVWVLLVSIYVLVLNYRHKKDIDDEGIRNSLMDDLH